MEVAIEFHRNGPWELPEGWVWARLGDVCVPPGRIDPAKQLKCQFRYIDLSAIDDGHVTQPQDVQVTQAPSRARQLVRAGDTLLSCVRVYLRNNAIVPKELDGAVASTAFCVLRPSDAIDPHYLFWFVHSRKFTDILVPLQRGNSPPAVLDDDIRNQLIPIAPLAEQRRIVMRIDELFTEISDGETALAQARDDLGTWRRALLKAAVTGELTREWRELRRSNETGGDFVNRIRQAKRLPLGAALRVIEQSGLPELPDDWTWATLPELCISDHRNGISIKGTPAPPGVKALRLDALTTSGLDLTACRYIPLEHRRIDAYRVNAHDFLISRANGSAQFVGRAVYVSSVAEEFVFPDTIIRYPLFPSDALGLWLEVAWNGPLTRSQIIAKAKTSAGILKISQDDIAQIGIPVPPEHEMIELVRNIQSNTEIAEATQYIGESEKDGRKLRQSILKSAFEGRLVDQDARDEPAERLLARLSEQSGATPPARRPRGRRAAVAAE